MRYPTPKSVLYDLARKGSSRTRAEALRLMALELPPRFGPYPRRSRESLLRQLVCGKKRRSSVTRLRHFKELIFGMSVEMQIELDAERKRKENRGRRRKIESNS